MCLKPFPDHRLLGFSEGLGCRAFEVGSLSRVDLYQVSLKAAPGLRKSGLEKGAMAKISRH
jgi:hypothetical protein